jgi:16S rRNA (cytosine967-C5)-methyltransferase
MTPGARTESAIGLLSAIQTAAMPADRIAARWFRERRYAGAKDRAWIAEIVFDALRHRAELDWVLAAAGEQELTPRHRMIAALSRLEGLDADALTARFGADRYGPEALTEHEQALAVRLSAANGEPPPEVRCNAPTDLAGELRGGLGEAWMDELATMTARAPVDLRVNALRTDPDTARTRLAEQGIETAPTPYAPWGLRLCGRANVSGSAAFRDGMIEVQDEGSQLAAALVDARPGHVAVDMCAGAGGKTLALAAAMQNQGRIVATDIEPARLAQAPLRIRRSGATVIEIADSLAGLDGAVDRVLLDVPCSGSGTWRRNPALKWRTTPDAINGFAAQQAEILDTGASLVAIGGRLVYVTCSVLAAENRRQIDAFLGRHAGFRLLPIAEPWGEVLGGAPPVAGDCLQLSPLRTGTDGFFVAVLERAD